jgi:alkylation response protein AidB-like acyl-CoA dehydrogenase
MATVAATLPKTRGGAFLIEERSPEEIFTAEDFTQEHLAIARTAAGFWNQDVAPHLEAVQNQETGVAVGILRKAAELGLTAATIPEQYGGMEMDLVSAMIVAEQVARDGSVAAWFGAHTGIGTLPILLFGTEEQKQRYLPRLATAEMVAAYALTEAHAGSDALAARTRADLSPDGRHYILNGQKMWITNGGVADLITVFAKVDGEKFTAFLVERGFGVKAGAEEKKMGIKGSSTTAIYLDNVAVPVENVLGEIGRGHIIAFNILNLGRLKLGPFAVGGARQVLKVSAGYARERHAFGGPIVRFGLIQAKLADMAARLFAAETLSYAVCGFIESRLEGFSWSAPDAARTKLKAIEEFAAECSMVKVYASEMLDFVVDEGVQIHGGYGYHQDYLVERAYRDSRINRIFEGTNEINRLLVTGMLLKRAARGQLDLVGAVKRVQALLLEPPSPAARLAPHAAAKNIALLALGAAYARFRDRLEHQQEILAALTDAIMGALVMECVSLRAARLAATSRAEFTADIAAVINHTTLRTVEDAARLVLSACREGDELRISLAALKRLAKAEPVDLIAARRRIAAGWVY